MKLQTFDRNLIREYMEYSPALDQGIRYCKYLDPTVSDMVAKESAIRLAINICEKKWYNDSTGYISSERVAFTEFEKDVANKRYFYEKGMKQPAKEPRTKDTHYVPSTIADDDDRAAKKAEDAARRKEEAEKEQTQRWKNEEKRVLDLKMLCAEKGLDFDLENNKAVKSLKVRNSLAFWIESLSALAFFAAIILWIFTDIGNYLVWLPTIVISVVLFFVTDAKIDPKLPDDYFTKIKKGEYNFYK
ncbi:MAG: hypothetical protein IIU77_07285 [Clostridia bacterium]|nr:hypothetical protein [Clostridia bacterium]MBQ5602605.1 hypothetical protein [Clostridia bacterium]